MSDDIWQYMEEDFPCRGGGGCIKYSMYVTRITNVLVLESTAQSEKCCNVLEWDLKH